MNIKIILLILILIISFFPLIIHAQEGPIVCCKLNNEIKFDGTTWNSGIWVGETSCSGGTITADCTGATQDTNCCTTKWGMLCALNSVYTVINWVFTILIAAVSLFTIWGAYDILTAAGDPEKLKKGRERIMYAMVGLAVALLSRAVPGLVESLL